MGRLQFKMGHIRMASTSNQKRFARPRWETQERAKQTGEILPGQIMKEQDEKRQEEIKVPGEEGTRGRTEQPVRSQDTRPGQTGIWIPDEARLQGLGGGTVG